MTDGYEDTPYVKGSKKTKTKKGTGRGVCQATHAPHDWLWVHTGLYNYPNYQWVVSLYKLCVDCNGYAYGKYLRAESRKKLWDKMVEVTGDESLIFMSHNSLKSHNCIKIKK